MAATLRPLTSKDVSNNAIPLRNSTGLNIDAISVLDNAYMTTDYDDVLVERSEVGKHRRQSLQLVKPTFNHVLGQSNASLLRVLLNIDQKLWLSIVNYKTVYDLNEKEFVSVDDADSSHNVLIGAEIAEHLIKEMDLAKEKVNCLYTAIAEYLKGNVNPRDFITIDKNSTGFELAGGYYAHYDPKVLAKNLKRGRTVSKFESSFANDLLTNGYTRFSLLVNMPQDKSSLFGMLNYYIIIIPKDMRPRMDNRDHRLTKLYSKVIIANNNLRTELNNEQLITRSKTYYRLERAVRNLQAFNAQKEKDDDTSILERLKTKKGQIRNKNLGKRQDYSGRAVVCINPYLPLDVIRIPESILPKLFQYHVLPYLVEGIKKNAYYRKHNMPTDPKFDKIKLTNLASPDAQAEMLRIINEHKILDRVPIVLGRQPTLHKQSLQGFHVEATPFSAIEVNPLICPAFNMDFDGDQAHIEVPLGPEAVQEVNDLILTTQNLFLAKTGECTTEPRQEMLYGLWTCTRDKYKMGAPIASYATYWEIRDAVMTHKVRVWDTVTCVECGGNILAGDAAVIACFAPGDVLPRGRVEAGKMTLCQVDKKSISKYIDYLLRIKSNGEYIHPIGTGVGHKTHNTSTFVGAIDALVELGFKVARLYPCDLSILGEQPSIPAFDNAVANFHKSMADIDLLYNLGLETPANYKIEFSDKLNTLNAVKRDNIIAKLGEDNGYVKLSESGARGSRDNLLQSFSLKGQVKKNETESFDALIENSYMTQLTPMEHFVAAYGGRQGQIDKSLKTGDTGYAMRLMWHATQGMYITENDCGTNRGLPITKKELAVYIDDEDTDKVSKEISEIFEHTIYGRYAANVSSIDTSPEADQAREMYNKYHLNSNTLISKDLAHQIATDPDFETIYLRSPLTCNNPCCAKCYGIDWSTRKIAVKGLPVGIIAAQSIGESGTQLSLDQFHKGGVAEEAQSMSAFDKVDHYINMAHIAKQSAKGKYPTYDPLAWDTGTVVRQRSSTIGKDRITIVGPTKSNKSILIPSSVALKETVVKGQGITLTHGDYDVHEVLEYNDITTAQKYLMFKLYSLFKNEFNIKIAHFECLVASMTRYMIVSTNRKDLMIGQYATSSELYAGRVDGTRYIPRIIGVKELPRASHSALDGMIMERQVEGLSRACLLNMTDSLQKPINNIVLGLPGKYGSAIPGFVESRKENI